MKRLALAFLLLPSLSLARLNTAGEARPDALFNGVAGYGWGAFIQAPMLDAFKAKKIPLWTTIATGATWGLGLEIYQNQKYGNHSTGGVALDRDNGLDIGARMAGAFVGGLLYQLAKDLERKGRLK